MPIVPLSNMLFNNLVNIIIIRKPLKSSNPRINLSTLFLKVSLAVILMVFVKIFMRSHISFLKQDYFYSRISLLWKYKHNVLLNS